MMLRSFSICVALAMLIVAVTPKIVPSAAAEESSSAAPAGDILPSTDARSELRDVDQTMLPNGHRVGHVYLGGQPTQQQLRRLKEAGVNTVISLREPVELQWDESAEVRKLGMKWISLPIGSLDDVNATHVAKARRALRSADKSNQVLLHCAVGGRVAAVWLVHRLNDADMDHDAAMEEAEKVGLTSSALKKRALQAAEAK